MPRKDNNPHSIDWEYIKEIEAGTKPRLQYRDDFATQANYNATSRQLIVLLNYSLNDLGKEFTNLASVEQLNDWQDKYLDKIITGVAYNIVREGLNEQMNFPEHNAYEFE